MTDYDNLRNRMDKLELKVESLNEKTITNLTQYTYIVKSIEELKGQVDKIVNIPNKRWELVISVVITAIVTGVIATFIRK
jgi:predicted nuclease with TOPRIM domain